MLLFLALLAIAGCDRQKPEAQQGEAAGTPVAGVKRGVDRSHKGKRRRMLRSAIPMAGKSAWPTSAACRCWSILWASWCAPCIKELPTLGKLEDAHSLDGQLGVIAVNQDDLAPKSSVDAFLADKKIGRFAAFRDPEMGPVGSAQYPDHADQRALRCRRARSVALHRRSRLDRRRKRLSCLRRPAPAGRLKQAARRSRQVPSAINAIPAKSRGDRTSARNSPPSRMANGGTSNVTRSALVAPALSISRK